MAGPPGQRLVRRARETSASAAIRTSPQSSHLSETVAIFRPPTVQDSWPHTSRCPTCRCNISHKWPTRVSDPLRSSLDDIVCIAPAGSVATKTFPGQRQVERYGPLPAAAGFGHTWCMCSCTHVRPTRVSVPSVSFDISAWSRRSAVRVLY